MEKERTYHIIRNGVKEEVTTSALNRIDESTDNNYELDIEWYLSHGYVTLEDFKKHILVDYFAAMHIKTQ